MQNTIHIFVIIRIFRLFAMQFLISNWQYTYLRDFYKTKRKSIKILYGAENKNCEHVTENENVPFH